MREANFVAWMPQGALTQNQQTIETSEGNFEFESIGSYSNLGRFVVGFSHELDSTPEDTEAALDWVQTRIASDQTDFNVSGESDITFNTYPGKDFILADDEETIFFRLLIVDNRLYVLALSQPSDIASVEAKVAFFNSFQLL